MPCLLTHKSITRLKSFPFQKAAKKKVMGNCLVLEEKVVKVMRTDGKILEYKAPTNVHQVLSEFSGHAISDSFPDFRHLQPDTKLLGGNLYYLVPLPLARQERKKKKVRFSNPEVEENGGQGSGFVRIKLVISKQELQELLQKGGEESVHEIVSKIQSKQLRIKEIDHESDGGDTNCRGWKPVLESIPEVN
ncbi:uncharacterized protein LOC110822737 [Carica papaya]|uniref:uncharacterized protein LOC110822737 n=1 Tax=Carica papaya TaxID=3649 RepID=UPI000B8CC030|nr:uncharacterized protein LOC110822737 [Carica papaya]